jgi:hypothetical protein
MLGLPLPSSSEVYESVLEHAEQLLSPLVFNCLPLALSLHSHSPSVAMYQQVRCNLLQSLYLTIRCVGHVTSRVTDTAGGREVEVSE